jgi:hypothetical protein
LTRRKEMKKIARKLILSRETLLHLDRSALPRAGGQLEAKPTSTGLPTHFDCPEEGAFADARLVAACA